MTDDCRSILLTDPQLGMCILVIVKKVMVTRALCEQMLFWA